MADGKAGHNDLCFRFCLPKDCSSDIVLNSCSKVLHGQKPLSQLGRLHAYGKVPEGKVLLQLPPGSPPDLPGISFLPDQLQSSACWHEGEASEILFSKGKTLPYPGRSLHPGLHCSMVPDRKPVLLLILYFLTGY